MQISGANVSRIIYQRTQIFPFLSIRRAARVRFGIAIGLAQFVLCTYMYYFDFVFYMRCVIGKSIAFGYVCARNADYFEFVMYWIIVGFNSILIRRFSVTHQGYSVLTKVWFYFFLIRMIKKFFTLFFCWKLRWNESIKKCRRRKFACRNLVTLFFRIIPLLLRNVLFSILFTPKTDLFYLLDTICTIRRKKISRNSQKFARKIITSIVKIFFKNPVEIIIHEKKPRKKYSFKSVHK